MSKYQVGDRVELLVDHPESNSVLVAGDLGTVCYVSEYGDERRLGVAWDKGCGHSCDGNCEDLHGWYVYDDVVAPFDEGADGDMDVFSDEDIRSLFG
mgnify:CR=1 FL=1